MPDNPLIPCGTFGHFPLDLCISGSLSFLPSLLLLTIIFPTTAYAYCPLRFHVQAYLHVSSGVAWYMT